MLSLGTVKFNVYGRRLKFHILPEETTFVEDGMLGNNFLKRWNVELSYEKRTLRFKDVVIPFLIDSPESETGSSGSSGEDSESEDTSSDDEKEGAKAPPNFERLSEILTEAEENLEAKASVNHIYKISRHRGVPNKIKYRLPPRSKVPIEIPIVADQSEGEGYLAQIDTTPGVFMGQAAVSHKDGTCFIMAINTREDPVEVDIPAQEVQPFDLSDSEEFFDSEADGPISYSLNDRIDKIYKTLRKGYHNQAALDQLKRVIAAYPYLFMLPGDDPPRAKNAQHRIPTTDDTPVFTKQYRYPPNLQKEVRNQVDDMLERGVITHSKSPYSAPLWIVPKKPSADGRRKHRVVFDYRKLNAKTIPDKYPLPKITEILETMGQAKYFSVFDLVWGFHQVEIHPDDRHKTAFTTPYGHFEFVCMPFGLCNAPPTFQRLMDTVMLGLQGIELFIYLDDLIIFANTLEEHETKVTEAFRRLYEAGLKLQLEKCEFLTPEVNYLGHKISRLGVHPDPAKIRAISNFPVPTNITAVRYFLGLAGYYRRFIHHFANIARPLHNLTKKDQRFTWTPEHQESFENLKEALCKAPVLMCADMDKDFILTTDASEVGIGAVLSQGTPGCDKPVAYMSRCLNKHEKNYSTTEKECLAVVYSVMYFRHYLYGRKFLVIGDHEPLGYIESIKDPVSRLNRWRATLRGYQYDFNYKPGKLNANADALSRYPVDTPESLSKTLTRIKLLPIGAPKPTKTSLARERSMRAKSEGDTSDPQKAIIQVRRGPGRPKGSRNAPLIPPSGIQPGQAELDGSTIAKRTRARKIESRNPETRKSVRFDEPSDHASDSGSRTESESTTSETPYDRETRTLDCGPPIPQKSTSLLPGLVQENITSTTTVTDTDTDIALDKVHPDADSEFEEIEREYRKLTRTKEQNKTQLPSPSVPGSSSRPDPSYSSPSDTSIEDEPIPDHHSTQRRSRTGDETLTPVELSDDVFEQDSNKEFKSAHPLSLWWDEESWATFKERADLPLEVLVRDQDIVASDPVIYRNDLEPLNTADHILRPYSDGEVRKWEDYRNVIDSDSSSESSEISGTTKAIPLPRTTLGPTAKSTPTRKSVIPSTSQWQQVSVIPCETTNEKPNNETIIKSKIPRPQHRSKDSQGRINRPPQSEALRTSDFGLQSRTQFSPVVDAVSSTIEAGVSHQPPPLLKILPSRECLTHGRDNIIHFISQDLVVNSPNGRLLSELRLIDFESLNDKLPQLGQVSHFTKRDRHIFICSVTDNHIFPLKPSVVEECFTNLAEILEEKSEIKTIRIARKGELTDRLPKGEIHRLVRKHLSHLPITITICSGVCETPPVDTHLTILRECHDSLFGGHRGVEKTYKRIRERYSWPNMRREIENYIAKCEICQEQKLIGNHVKEEMIITDTPTEPFYKVCIDTVGPMLRTPSNNEHIVTMQCQFSKFCLAIPVNNIKAKTIAEAIAHHLIPVHGVPRVILTDRSKSFRNKLLKTLSEVFGFALLTTTAYHPQSNASLERSHAVLKAYLRTKCKNKRDWDKTVGYAMMEYNSSPHSSTGYTPYEVLTGRNPRMPSRYPDEYTIESYPNYTRDLVTRLGEIKEVVHKNLIESKQRSKTYYDMKAHPQEIKVGDLVYLLRKARKNKLEKFYDGKFKVLEVKANNNLVLEAPNGKQTTVHKDRVKLYR